MPYGWKAGTAVANRADHGGTADRGQIRGAFTSRLRYSSAGAAGSLILIVVWVYYSALILFLGAQITKVVACSFGKPITPKAHAKRAQET